MRYLRNCLLPLLIGTSAILVAQPPAPKPNPAWKQLDFLLGKWIGVAGEKDTPLGAGEGAFSFVQELNGRIIVRRNNATYASGAKHDDLLMIYADPPDSPPRAIYFDSEGHTIRYSVKLPAANAVVFESDGSQPGPRYRLSYWIEAEVLKGKFEVAPPGADFKAYMNWSARRN